MSNHLPPFPNRTGNREKRIGLAEKTPLCASAQHWKNQGPGQGRKQVGADGGILALIPRWLSTRNTRGWSGAQGGAISVSQE